MERDIFEDEHDEYRQLIRAFLEREVIPHYAAWERERIVPRSLFKSLGALGAFGFDVAEAHGGAGVQDLRFNAILAEEACDLAVHPALVGLILQADVVVPYLVGLTTEHQRARWLPGVTAGTTITAIAMTEPGTGSDLAGIRTRAVRDGEYYVLNGSKTFITNGINADLVVVAARTAVDSHRGLSLFVIERGMAGFERGQSLEKIGLHAQDTAELTFTDVRIPVENRLGEEGEGFLGLTKNLARERLSVAVSAMATTRWAIEATSAHVRQRQAFGRPLATLQTVRHRLAELATEADIGTLFVDRSIRAYNAGTLSHVDAAKAKWWTTELQGRALDAGVQLHGGYGFMQEYPIARAWADGRVSRIYGGANEIMKEIIGRDLLAAR